MNRNQKGVGSLELVLMVVLVGLVGVIGWYVYQANQDTLKDDNLSDSAATQSEVPQVSSASDLQASEDYLNSQDLDEQLNTSEIDAALED